MIDDVIVDLFEYVVLDVIEWVVVVDVEIVFGLGGGLLMDVVKLIVVFVLG